MEGAKEGPASLDSAAVFKENRERIHRYILRMVRDPTEAEDLTQETFTAAWANIDGYKAQASIGTWLHKIAYHKFIDSKRRLERHVTLMAKLKKEGRNLRKPSNPLQQLMADEDSRLMYEAMCRLELEEYIVIVLHYIQGLSFREMAKVLDEAVGTVKWRTSKALKRLKAFLSSKV